MTGGYSVEIKEAIETGNSLKIIVLEKKPGKNCFVTQEITYPYDALLIPKTAETLLEIEYRVDVKDC